MNALKSIAVATAIMTFNAAAPAAADDYPAKPVRVIVVFPPGGSNDVVARIVFQKVSEHLGQQFVIENRGGVAGNPNFYTKFPVKPARDLMPITQVVDVPGCLVVNPALQVSTVKDLVAYLKSNPSKINFGSPAPSSANALEMEMFLHSSGTRAMQVPYKGGAGPATIGLLGNEVQMMFVTLSSAIAFVKQGQLRLLAVIAPARVAVLPDAPTMREQGYDMVVGSWQGIFVPAGTPPKIVNALFRTSRDTMRDADVVKRLGDSGVSVVVSDSPAAFSAFVTKESARFAKVIKDAHIATD